MTAQEVAEFTELRATIRQRVTQRLWLFVVTLGLWAAATMTIAAFTTLPVAALLPLLLLAGGFETIVQLHTGVERIGRYLQVFYDETDPTAKERNWERTAMAYGRAYPGGSDALFGVHFFLAVLLNFVPVTLAEPVKIDVVVVAAAHVAFVGRLLVARRAAARQRAVDLERFEHIRRNPTGKTTK